MGRDSQDLRQSSITLEQQFRRGVVVVVQLAEWSLPKAEDSGSKPAIGNYYMEHSFTL